MNITNYIINYLEFYLRLYFILAIPAIPIYLIFKSLYIKYKHRKNVKTFKNIEIPIWNREPNENDELIYKFIGFSNIDGKSKYLSIEKTNILNEYESLCLSKINQYAKKNEHIKVIYKIPLKQFITITNEDKLFRGWRQKMEAIIIDFLITDHHNNIIAAIQFEGHKDTNNLIDDTFFNIRIPIFWISKDKETFSYQIKDIFERLNNYFEKANLIKKEENVYSKLYKE